MKPALAPLEVDWSFGNTHARHDRARWLSEAHCNQGMRSELEALLWGLVSVRFCSRTAQNFLTLPTSALLEVSVRNYLVYWQADDLPVVAAWFAHACRSSAYHAGICTIVFQHR